MKVTVTWDYDAVSNPTVDAFKIGFFKDVLLTQRVFQFGGSPASTRSLITEVPDGDYYVSVQPLISATNTTGPWASPVRTSVGGSNPNPPPKAPDPVTNLKVVVG